MGNNQSGDSKKKNAPAFNDMILGNLKSRSGKDTNKWINNLTNENENEIVEASDTSARNLQSGTMTPQAAQAHIKRVDKLFDLFQQYEVEFNRVINSQDLALETERPIVSSELFSRMQGNPALHFSGRLHTRYWTLIILGNFQFIEGYIIPSDHFIGFEANQASYPQFFYITPVVSANELNWNCEGSLINEGLLPAFAKQIFGQLVKVAKGEASDEDRFQFGNKKKTKSAVEGNQPAASFMSHGNVFDDGALQSDTTLQSGATVDNARVQHPSNSQNSGFDSSEYLVSENSTQASVPRNDNQTADKAPVKSLTATEAISFNDACVLLQTSFESELARLVKEGTKAFEAHDFTLAEKLLKKTAKMKSMKDQIISTISVWQNSLAED